MNLRLRIAVVLFLGVQGCSLWEPEPLAPVSAAKIAIARKQCPKEIFQGQPLLSGSALCSVNEVRRIGEIEGRVLHAGLYRALKPDDIDVATVADHPPLNNTAVVIFEEKQGDLVTVWNATSEGVLGSDWFEMPRILRLPDGPGIVIPHRYSGTGFVNADRFLALRDEKWSEIDTSSWLGDLRAKLPTGLEILKGVELDLEKMTAHSALWRKDDANCCPSGGNVDVNLTLKDLQLEISSIDIGGNNLEGSGTP